MEEASLFGQLGINWKLFLSQAFNFFLLLIILRAFVYKPLLAAIKKRNEKIQEGLDKAHEADIRLKEVDDIAKKHLQKAGQESIQIIAATQERAKKLEESLTKKAQEKQQQLLVQAQEIYKKQQEENRNLVLAEAGELVKKIIIKTVELKPEDIDGALIKKAVSQLQHEN